MSEFKNFPELLSNLLKCRTPQKNKKPGAESTIISTGCSYKMPRTAIEAEETIRKQVASPSPRALLAA